MRVETFRRFGCGSGYGCGCDSGCEIYWFCCYYPHTLKAILVSRMQNFLWQLPGSLRLVRILSSLHYTNGEIVSRMCRVLDCTVQTCAYEDSIGCILQTSCVVYIAHHLWGVHFTPLVLCKLYNFCGVYITHLIQPKLPARGQKPNIRRVLGSFLEITAHK